MIHGTPAEHLIASRLLVLQTKRLMLASLERRLTSSSQVALRDRVEGLRQATAHADHMYRAAVLEHGSPSQADYWLVAYARLIGMGNALALKLREATATFAPEDRYAISADVEMLELIVGTWTQSMRSAMAEDVA